MGDMHEVTRLSPEMGSRKLQVLEFVRGFYLMRGTGPSISEVARAVDCARSRAQKLVTKLVHEGHLHRIDGMTRGVRPATALEDALRELRAAGYIVNEDVLAIDLPAQLLDVDDSGALIVRHGWTNAPLPLLPARAQEGRDRGDGGGEESQGSAGAGRAA